MPSPTRGDGGDEDGSDEEAGIGAGVEEAGGEGTLFGGEPLGGGLDGGGEVAGLAEAEEDAGDAEAGDTGDQRVAEGSQAPNEDGQGVTGLGAELIDDAAGEEEADAVGDLEGLDDVAVVEVIGDLEFGVEIGDPTHEGKMELRLDEREDRAVHVIDGGGEKEQEADEPAHAGGGFRGV